MLYQSKYNHLIEVELDNNGKKYVLMNLFNGASVFINSNYFNILHNNIVLPKKSLDVKLQDYLIERGYLYHSIHKENDLVNQTFNQMADREYLSANLKGGFYGFITSLYCNLKCPYCFQQLNADSIGFLSEKQIDKALEMIKKCEDEIKDKYKITDTVPKISITGGEPLLLNQNNITSLKYLLSRLTLLNYPYTITTNGTTLPDFIDKIKIEENCRNIQVTLDGPEEIHNKRRYYRNGKGSFHDICKGIDYCLSKNIKITLRVNLDITNIEYLFDLAKYIKKAWSNNKNFYAYVSPITDHGNLGNYENPKDESNLLEALLDVIQKHPIVKKIFDIKHFRGFNYVEQILVKKEPKYPVIFRCEAVLGMFIFAPNDKVYVCLESVGTEGLEVGKYYPNWDINEIMYNKWSQRNVLDIDTCNDCKIRFICAGGCSIEAFSKTTKHNCMPFLNEIDIAWKYFAKTRPDYFNT